MTATSQSAAVPPRSPRRATTTTPIVRASTGTTRPGWQLTANPAATPASTTAGRGSGRWRSMPSAASRKKTAAMSLFASPGCVRVISGEPSTTATPTRAAGPAPRDRPMHHAARKASASHAALMSGERLSLPNSNMPVAWNNSAVAGKNTVRGSRSLKCRRVSQPVWTALAANGRWNHCVSTFSKPWLTTPRTRDSHSTDTEPTAANATSRASGEPAPTVTICSADLPPARVTSVRRRPMAAAVSPATTHAATTAPRRNRPTLPSASSTPTTTARPMTTSASRAGAPDHPGRSPDRSHHAPTPTTAVTRDRSSTPSR